MSGRTFVSTPVYPLGSGAMVKIMDFALAGTTALRAAAIPQTFTHLRVVGIGQSQRAGVANTGLRLSHNGNTASAYQYDYYGYGAGLAANAITSGGAGAVGVYLGQTPAGSRANDNYVSQFVVDIPNYNVAGVVRMFLSNSYFHDGVNGRQSMTSGGVWMNDTNVITQLDIGDDVAGALGPRARASLYGIA